MESLGGLGLGLSTLLGPEGSLTVVGGFSVRTDAGMSFGGVWGRVVARVLRTSQWTRASL